MSKWYYRFPSGHSVDLLIYSNFNPGFFFFLSNSLAWIIFSIFWAHPIIKLYAKRIQLNWLFKLSYLGSKFAQALGYVNPALNKPALVVSDWCITNLAHGRWGSIQSIYCWRYLRKKLFPQRSVVVKIGYYAVWSWASTLQESQFHCPCWCC